VVTAVWGSTFVLVRDAVAFATHVLLLGRLAGERLSGRGWLGAGLILAGMLIAELGGRPEAPGRPRTDGGQP
jgi:hypothetical protein